MTITAHELVVRCCAYFPASLSTPSLIVTCSDDKTLKLWNAITGEGLKTFKGSIKFF
jgi:WD40 repeat protein